MKLTTQHEEVEIPERYHYATMKLEHVLRMTCVPVPKDAYLSEDEQGKTLRDLLRKGYRWIRTEGEYAVFEKTVGLVAPHRRKRP